MPTGIYEHEVTLHTDTLLNREPCRLRRERDEFICLVCPLKECIYEYDDERGSRERITPQSTCTIIFNEILGPEEKRVKNTKIGRPKIKSRGCPECGKTVSPGCEFKPYCCIECSDIAYGRLLKKPTRGELKDRHTQNCLACGKPLLPLKERREKSLGYYCSAECRDRCYGIPGDDLPGDEISTDIPFLNSPDGRNVRRCGLATMVGFPSMNPDPNPYWESVKNYA